MKTRVMKTRLIFAKKIKENENALIKEVMANIRENAGNKWNKELNKYLEEIGITYNELLNIKPEEIKEMIKEYDSKLWKDEMEKKSPLKYYRNWKQKIEDEEIYKNDYESKLYFQARTNQLPLQNRTDNDEEKLCKTRSEEIEDILHLLFRCKNYENIRIKYEINKH